jgi:hypothetical protein
MNLAYSMITVLSAINGSGHMQRGEQHKSQATNTNSTA